MLNKFKYAKMTSNENPKCKMRVKNIKQFSDRQFGKTKN